MKKSQKRVSLPIWLSIIVIVLFSVSVYAYLNRANSQAGLSVGSAKYVAPELEIISPKGGAAFKTNEVIHVSWKSDEQKFPGVIVQILSSLDCGTYKPYDSQSGCRGFEVYNGKNTGSFDWTVSPGYPVSDNYLVRVQTYPEVGNPTSRGRGGSAATDFFSIFQDPIAMAEGAKKVEVKAIPADWKTYTNPVYGYSIRYPLDAEREKHDPESANWQLPLVTPRDSHWKGFRIEVEDRVEYNQCDRAMAELSDRETIGDTTFFVEEWVNGGMVSSSVQRNYATPRGDKCYSLSYTFGSSRYLEDDGKKTDREAEREVALQMLSTFRFADK